VNFIQNNLITIFIFSFYFRNEFIDSFADIFEVFLVGMNAERNSILINNFSDEIIKKKLYFI